jgi:hypothetical protein
MRRKASQGVEWLGVLGLAFSLAPFSFAQSPGKDRIVGAIENASPVALEGNLRPMFGPENDRGAVEGSLKLENISLEFRLTESQQAGLKALLDDLQNPSSPNFHKWLTPEQFADRFGLSRNDIDRIAAWLEGQGFTVTWNARSRTWVSFSGTAAQVEAAFRTEIHNFSFHGETYFANATEPAVPSALADVVLAIDGLDNYRPRPGSVVRRVSPSLQPDFTSHISGNTYVAPDDFAVIYDLNSLYAARIDGTGQSIAVMGQTDLYSDGSGPSSDITAFRSAAGLPPNLPQVILIPGAADPGVVSGDIGEATLDVEWAGAVARNATIIFVNGGAKGVLDALQYAVDNKTAPVISISYTACEPTMGSANLNAAATLAQQANAQGQTIVAPAGDTGPAGCQDTDTTVATTGLAVSWPADLPYVTGMGGSEFNEGPGIYWAAATSGVDVSPSALSYIPEMAWNDTSSPSNPQHDLWAGGGGASAYFPKPSWQTGTGVPDDGARDVPDLSLNSSFYHDGSLVCIQGSCVNGFRDSNLDLAVGGGTSIAAPCFAGIVALINQKMNTPKGQGNVNPTLYSMAATTPAAFHDITTGNNIVPCAEGSPDCPATAPFQFGFSAGVGYDQATGLGSVDAFNLVTAWGSSVAGNLPAPTLIAPANGATGVALSPNFSWTAVAGNAGYRILIATTPADMPTNPATATCGACTVVDTTSADSTSYTPPSALEAGTYFWQVQAIEPSSSSGTAAWSNVSSFTTTVPTLAAPTLTAPASGATGVSLTPTFTWTAVTGNAGYLIFIATTQGVLPTNAAVQTCSGCATGTLVSTNSYTPPSTPAAGNLAAGTYYWQVKALPSSPGVYGAWSAVSSFTTVPADFSLSASPSALTMNPGSIATSTLTLTPINGLSGSSVSFSCSVSSSLVGVTCSVGALSSNNTATVTIMASSSASNLPSLDKNRLYCPDFGRNAGFQPALEPPRWRRYAQTRTVPNRLFRPGPTPVSLAAGLLLMVLIVLCWRDSQRLRWKACALEMASGALLAGLLATGLSCGGGSSASSSPPSESGTVTVQGTGPTTSHSVAISVTVD